jgi:hypothetical protein
MRKRLLLVAMIVFALPLVVNSSSAAPCQQWNAWSPAQHHRVGQLDVVGGHGYGSGYHGDSFESPPQPPGRYGDPRRAAGEGGYVQYKFGVLIVNVNFFGPLDENDTSHIYDTAGGACVSYGNTAVKTPNICSPTSRVRPPAGNWQPCT